MCHYKTFLRYVCYRGIWMLQICRATCVNGRGECRGEMFTEVTGLSPKSIERVRSKVMAFHKKAFAVWFSQVGWWALFVTYTIIQSIMRSEMCSLHLTHPSVHTWSSGQPTVQRPGSSRGLPVGAGIRTHNLGLPQVSSPTLYPLGQRLPIEGVSPSRVAVQILHPCAVALPVEVLRGAGVCLTAFKLLATVFRVPSEHHIAHTHRECQSGYRPPRSSLFWKMSVRWVLRLLLFKG